MRGRIPKDAKFERVGFERWRGYGIVACEAWTDQIRSARENEHFEAVFQRVDIPAVFDTEFGVDFELVQSVEGVRRGGQNFAKPVRGDR